MTAFSLKQPSLKSATLGSHSRSTYAQRQGEGSTLKAYENVQREGEPTQSVCVRFEKIANSINSAGDFRSHISMIEQVSNLLMSCLASSTHLLAGFKYCK